MNNLSRFLTQCEHREDLLRSWLPFIELLNTQLCSANLLSKRSQQIGSANMLSSCAQKIGPANMLSKCAQQISPANMLSKCAQQVSSQMSPANTLSKSAKQLCWAKTLSKCFKHGKNAITKIRLLALTWCDGMTGYLYELTLMLMVILSVLLYLGLQ